MPSDLFIIDDERSPEPFDTLEAPDETESAEDEYTCVDCYNTYAESFMRNLGCSCCWVCNDCDDDRDRSRYDDDYDDEDEDLPRIRSWDYRPNSFKPKGNFPTEVLMGVELEVGHYSSREIRRAVAELDASKVDPDGDHIYLKEDGSITGAEIVTHPMTLAYAREYKFPELLRNLRNRDCYAEDEYGLHIHVSRNAFKVAPKAKRSATHQLTWLLFIYRNAEKLQKLARRESNRWASFRKPTAHELVRKAQRVDRDDRYVAVNCNNEKTYELRFFQSTLDEQEFYAALEFADASVEYTRKIKAADVLRDQALSWNSFAQWVIEHNYPHLAAELKHLGIDGSRPELAVAA